MRNLFFAFCTLEQKNERESVWRTNEKFDFKNLSNILFVLELISKKQYEILLSLNGLRNEIVHKYF